MAAHDDSAQPRAQRLELALEAGLDLPETGRIGLFHPLASEILPPVAPDRLVIISPSAPVHAALKARGAALSLTDPEPGSLAGAIVCLPRGRIEALDLIARAAASTSGPVIVDGQKTDGIEPVLKALAGAGVRLEGPVSKGHGKIGWFTAQALDGWRAETARIEVDGQEFTTRPGIFSADAVDEGSRLLAEALPGEAKGVAVDLGAGWGYLAARLLAKAPSLRELHLVEADARALDCARLNVSDPRARFHWADATKPLPGLRADLVVMNPPFHQGRSADAKLGVSFIRAAAALLHPSGALWMVANRHLPYEASLSGLFRTVEEIGGTGAFKLIRASGIQRTAPAPAPARRRLRG